MFCFDFFSPFMISLTHHVLKGVSSVNEVISVAAAGRIAPHDFQSIENARALTLSIRPLEE
jgi:hypothetical protein